MIVIPLYRYVREDGGTTVSPNKPEGEYTEMHRLIADEGKALTDGATYCPCIDTDNVAGWREVDKPSEEE